MRPSRPMCTENREEVESQEVADREAESSNNNNNRNNISTNSGGNRIVMRNSLEVEEEEEMEEMGSDELLLGLPEATSPRFAMNVVPPGISSGTARTSEVRERDSECLVPSKIR